MQRFLFVPFSFLLSVGAVYTAAQRELNERILRAICADEEGHRRITRNGTFDGSGAFQNCGAYIFGILLLAVGIFDRKDITT